VVHYDYVLYALEVGEIDISSISATFSASMGYGQPKKEFALRSKALQFLVLSPKGVDKGQFILVTDNYTISQKIKPKKSKLIIGDAIEVEITQRAIGVPDILLKSIHYQSTPLLRVYEKEPILQSGAKGEFDVSRVDRFTLVAVAEGNVSTPEQSSIWWDTETREIHKESIPAMSFSIIADPQIAIDAKKAQKREQIIYLVVH